MPSFSISSRDCRSLLERVWITYQRRLSAPSVTPQLLCWIGIPSRRLDPLERRQRSNPSAHFFAKGLWQLLIFNLIRPLGRSNGGALRDPLVQPCAFRKVRRGRSKPPVVILDGTLDELFRRLAHRVVRKALDREDERHGGQLTLRARCGERRQHQPYHFLAVRHLVSPCLSPRALLPSSSVSLSTQ